MKGFISCSLSLVCFPQISFLLVNLAHVFDPCYLISYLPHLSHVVLKFLLIPLSWDSCAFYDCTLMNTYVHVKSFKFK